MKRCQTLLFMALLCCVYVVGCEKGQQMVETVVESPAAEEIPTEVNLIPDANLAAAIRETLGLSVDAPLTAEVLRDLKKLEAPGRQIADLTGLEYATNLEHDVSALATLTNLTAESGLWQLSQTCNSHKPALVRQSVIGCIGFGNSHKPDGTGSGRESVIGCIGFGNSHKPDRAVSAPQSVIGCIGFGNSHKPDRAVSGRQSVERGCD
jgi:hypothetical protein